MFFKGCLFCILALATLTYAIKVNLQGSLSLGKEVMDTLSHYLGGYRINGRRTLNPNLDSALIEVKTASLCKKLIICGQMSNFVDEYVMSLAQAVEAVFTGILDEKGEAEQAESKTLFGKLKGLLHDVRKILKVANQKITENKEAYLWVGIIKKISSKFHAKSITYIIERLDADKQINEIKKKLTQKLIINIAATEANAQKELCFEYRLCFRALECTKALNTVLGRVITLPNAQVKKFMKAFYDALPETTFYTRLNEVTANEFQVILNDMAYFDNVPTKEILKSIKQTLESRINSMDSDADVKEGQDILLVQIILSDMDYIFNRQKNDPFHAFIDYFLEWSKINGRIASQVKDVVKTIEYNIRSTSEDIVLKLIDEVRVFLEITVDP